MIATRTTWLRGDDDVAVRDVWWRAGMVIVPPVVALLVGLWRGAYRIDDAYITFRYAENLAAGRGLAFNPGESVLGTSTPLFAILLGLLRWVGFSVPAVARLIGLLSTMGVVAIVQRLAERWVGAIGASALAACVALHPDLALTANSGMETGLSMAAVYGAMLLAFQNRYFAAGLVGGAAFLLRLDGMLVAVLVVGLAAVRAPRRCWRALVGAVIVALPWVAYATVTYGGVVPHSVEAKQFLHPDTPMHILLATFRRLTFGPEMKAVFGLSVVGLVFASIRRSELLLVALWMLGYSAGQVSSRITLMFAWYFSPLVPGLILLAGAGLAGLAGVAAALPVRWRDAAIRRRLLAHRVIPAAFAILSVLGLLDAARWRGVMYEYIFGDRADAYLLIGELLRSRCQPGDVVLVGEVGAISYALPDQVILDSSGINSPGVLRVRREDRERLAPEWAGPGLPESAGWVTAVIEQYRPRYITTFRPWLHIETIMQDPRIRSRYHRILSDAPGLGDYFTLERTEDGSGEWPNRKNG